MSKPQKTKIRERGFCCRADCGAYIEVLVRAETDDVADRDAAVTARSHGWKIPTEGSQFLCHDCQEVRA